MHLFTWHIYSFYSKCKCFNKCCKCREINWLYIKEQTTHKWQQETSRIWDVWYYFMSVLIIKYSHIPFLLMENSPVLIHIQIKLKGDLDASVPPRSFFPELIWWENLHFLTILLYRYALHYFYPLSPRYFGACDGVDQTHMFAPEHLNIHYWFCLLKVKMLSEETWKTSLNRLNLKTNRSL